MMADDASNNDTAARTLQDKFLERSIAWFSEEARLCCASHIIQLAANKVGYALRC